jgi:hypothetical protein
MNQEPPQMQSCEPPAALNVLPWPVVPPKNRVGGSAAFSFVFAFQYIGQTLDTHGENGGCGYDFAPGVHKYLYVEDNPVNGIDPSGHDFADIEIGAPGTLIDMEATVAVGAPIAEEELAYGAMATRIGASVLSRIGLGIGATALLAEELGLFGSDERELIQLQVAEGNKGPTRSPYAAENKKCVEFAQDAMDYFTREGLRPRVITYDSYRHKTTGDNIMAADDFGFLGGDNISINGHHEGVLVDGFVFDNNVPFGVPRRDWEHGYLVTPIDRAPVELTLREANDQKYGVLVPDLH